jgi:hypothetical protein
MEAVLKGAAAVFEALSKVANPYAAIAIAIVVFTALAAYVIKNQSRNKPLLFLVIVLDFCLVVLAILWLVGRPSQGGGDPKPTPTPRPYTKTVIKRECDPLKAEREGNPALNDCIAVVECRDGFVIASFESVLGANGTCGTPTPCGHCDIGSQSCTVKFKVANYGEGSCKDCNTDDPKWGRLTVTCASTGWQ